MVGHSQRIPKIRDQRELSILVNETAKSHLLKPEILHYTQDDISFIRIMVIDTCHESRRIEMFTDKNIVIGKKQTLRALLRDEAETVYLSKDADLHVTKTIADICNEKNIEIIYYDSMKELGKSVGIGVNAAAAAVLK